jgi:hypothetical protein
VHALPLGFAAECSINYFWDYFSLFLFLPFFWPHTFLPEGVGLGFLFLMVYDAVLREMLNVDGTAMFVQFD